MSASYLLAQSSNPQYEQYFHGVSPAKLMAVVLCAFALFIIWRIMKTAGLLLKIAGWIAMAIIILWPGTYGLLGLRQGVVGIWEYIKNWVHLRA